MKKKKMIAIVYHYMANYRFGIFKSLNEDHLLDYTLISDKISPNNIKLLNPNLSKSVNKEGVFNWIFIKNVWLIKDKFLFQFGILKYLFSNKFSAFIFLGNPYFITTWIAAFILKIKSVPFYFWTHGVIRREKGPLKWMRFLFLRLPNGLFLYGNHAKEILIDNGFDNNKLHVIYNSLDYNLQKQLRQSLGITDFEKVRESRFTNPDLPLLIFIGRLTKQKKLHEFIEAVGNLRNEDFFVNVLFVGDGSEKSRLEDLALENDLSNNVFFEGECYDEKKSSLLIAASDICIAPGEVGLTAIHSLTFGTPVITHGEGFNQMPEFEAVVPGFSGDFFEYQNICDLAERIKLWVYNNENRDLVRKNCYAVIEKFYNPFYQNQVITEVIERDLNYD